MTIKITCCTAEELPLLREISMQTYRDTFADSNSETVMQQYFATAMTTQKLLQEFETQGSTFYFLSLDNKVVAFLKVNEGLAQSDNVGENSLEIERFYVRKHYLRQGLGGILMNFACDIAKQSAKSFIWLGVWEGNFSAIDFYKKQGFYQIGEHPYDMGGDIQTDLIFKKDI